MAELVEMRSQRIHGFSALLHELFARPERNRSGLLFLGLGFHKPHGRSQRRLDDCFRIGGVILLALDERLDVVRRDQPDLMPVAGHFPRPMMRTGAGLHHHEARRLLRHEPGELWSRQLLAEHDGPVRRCAVNLEHVLCQIDADDGNLSHGCPLLQLVLRHHEYGTSRCRQGESGIHPISILIY